MKYELALTIHDEDAAAGDLDREQPLAEYLEPLDRDNDANHATVEVADRDRERHRQPPKVGLVDLRHVRLPGGPEALVPLAKAVVSAVELRRLRFGHPEHPVRIRQSRAVQLWEGFAELPEMREHGLPVPPLHALPELKPPGVGAKHIHVASLPGLDGRGDAPGDGVVLSEVLPLLDVGGPDEEQRDPGEHDEQEGGHDSIEPS